VSGPDARSVAEGTGLDIEPGTGRRADLPDIPTMAVIFNAVRDRTPRS
jgi:hypothetical protein